MQDPQTSLDKAIQQLGLPNRISFGDQELTIACLIREADRRPFQAAWWKGKEVYLLGVDTKEISSFAIAMEAFVTGATRAKARLALLQVQRNS
ncbi:MAG TPA: hypothetical protein VEH27_16720 [Methylomirabilota bacterium]|nr:hypothetical protein [Methylomirabilota bacterium]